MESDGIWWTLVLLDTSVGVGMFIYGIRQKEPLPLVCGIVLNVLPMVPGNWPVLLGLTALTGAGFMILRKIL